MGKRTQVMSLSVPPALITELDSVAESRFGSANKRSHLACMLFEDFMNLDSQAHESLQRVAAKRGVPVSEVVEFLLDKFSIEDTTVQPIVLKVPVAIIKDKNLLQQWLSQKAAVLVNHLHPSE